MAETLRQYVNDDGEWPMEIEPFTNLTPPSGRCTCGRIVSLNSIYSLKIGHVVDRFSGRIRRSTMRKDLQDLLTGVSRTALRHIPEFSPAWACAWCHGKMRGLQSK